MEFMFHSLLDSQKCMEQDNLLRLREAEGNGLVKI